MARSLTDRGSVLAEFVLVSVLVVFVAFAVIQLALTLHVRNILVSSASEGAHLAALADRGPGDGERRTEMLVAAAIGEDYPVEADAMATTIDGQAAVTMTVTAPVPMLGLWGAGTMTVDARAIEEPADA